ncbi:MAG TPA: OmcB family cysteine-rich outer membrane protein [Verrucomicrobiae bacterium]|nr:OmcB family cysteine-rich outer membrane protein [Verrucomicrobiae bacterium]
MSGNQSLFEPGLNDSGNRAETSREIKEFVAARATILVCLSAVLLFTGCAQQQAARSTQTSRPPAPVPKVACSESTGGLIKLSKSMPAEATLGLEFLTELTVTASGCAANVVVRDVVPSGVSYARSEPAATLEEDQLIWKIGNLDDGQTLKLKVWFKAEREGQVVNCASVSADPRVCGVTFIGKPVLTFDNHGPTNGIIGTEVTYNLVVKNIGTATAKNLMVTNPVPPGLSHHTGKSELTFEVGDLAPHQSKTLPVTFKANQRGKVCNAATVTSANAGKLSAETCTVILVPGIKVEHTGSKEQILGRNADYEIIVSNTGDTVLDNVVLSDVVPAESALVAAPGATLSGNKATWYVAELKPGAKVTHSVKTTSKVAGTICNTATATVGNLSDSAKACTMWKGIAAVALEVVDNPDPIQIGENTLYTIRVINQGFADIHNVKLVATFDDKTAPISTDKGSISGRVVTTTVVPTLASKQVLTGTITVKGVKAGDSRNRVVLTCEELGSAVEETESTTVY